MYLPVSVFHKGIMLNGHKSWKIYENISKDTALQSACISHTRKSYQMLPKSMCVFSNVVFLKVSSRLSNQIFGNITKKSANNHSVHFIVVKACFRRRAEARCAEIISARLVSAWNTSLLDEENIAVLKQLY